MLYRVFLASHLTTVSRCRLSHRKASEEGQNTGRRISQCKHNFDSTASTLPPQLMGRKCCVHFNMAIFLDLLVAFGAHWLLCIWNKLNFYYPVSQVLLFDLYF